MIEDRIILDTSVVRSIAHEDPRSSDVARLGSHRDHVSVALANGVVPEIVLALYEGRLDWGAWSRAAIVLEQVLSIESPIAPDEEEWHQVVVPGGTPDPATQEHTQAMWRLLRRARSIADLERGQLFLEGLQLHKTSTDRESVTRAVEVHRERWRTVIDQTKALAGPRPDQDQIAAVLIQELGIETERDQARFDGYIRGVARFVDLGWRGSTPYNPHAEGRKGDSIDLELLMFLAIPAVVCTADLRLRRHLEAANSVQAPQLVGLADLVEHVEAGTLQTLLPPPLRRRR